MGMQIEVTVPSSVFAAALAQNVQLDFNQLLPKAAQGPFCSARLRIKGLVLVAAEDHAFELWAWSSATHAVATNTDAWLGRWSFLTTDAVQSAGDASWRYFIPDLDIPYFDADQTGKLHLTLIDRTIGGHVINQFILLKVYVEPEVAWS